MNKPITTLTAAVLCLALAGCTTSGLSLREVGQHNYSQFVYGLYDTPREAAPAPTPVKKPIKLAVAQIGEAAAPDAMIEQFRQQGYIIAQVQSLPAGQMEINPYQRASADKADDLPQQVRKMLQLARDIDADYLFLFGGTVSYGNTPNFLQVLDLTIVGAYLFPSVHHSAEGRASGALIDVNSGRPLFIASAESRIKRRTPSYLNYYGENEQVLTSLRDDLVGKLSEEFTKRLSAL